jgi:hypothetical protein
MNSTLRALPPRFKLRTLAKAAGAITIAFAAFMILVHVPAGRRLLAPIFGTKCPITPLNAQQAEAARAFAAKQTAGTGIAPARPALGFTLEKTTADDVRAWAARVGASCAEEREGALLKCTRVPADAVSPAIAGPALSEIVLMFEPAHMTLVNLTAYLTDVGEDVAAARAAAVGASLQKSLGPGQSVGEFTADALVRQRVATLSYRFEDYQADVSATQLETHRVMVREHYMAGAR